MSLRPQPPLPPVPDDTARVARAAFRRGNPYGHRQLGVEPQAECMLVLIGATPEGKKELVGFQVGVPRARRGGAGGRPQPELGPGAARGRLDQHRALPARPGDRILSTRAPPVPVRSRPAAYASGLSIAHTVAGAAARGGAGARSEGPRGTARLSYGASLPRHGARRVGAPGGGPRCGAAVKGAGAGRSARPSRAHPQAMGRSGVRRGEDPRPARGGAAGMTTGHAVRWRFAVDLGTGTLRGE